MGEAGKFGEDRGVWEVGFIVKGDDVGPRIIMNEVGDFYSKNKKFKPGDSNDKRSY